MNDKELIGLTLEEAYDAIHKAGLKSNLRRDEDGVVRATGHARIMILMPDYLTVSYDKKGIVTKVRRG
jgi:hypothetical protein